MHDSLDPQVFNGTHEIFGDLYFLFGRVFLLFILELFDFFKERAPR